ncbi:MAG: hypothetical protein ED556_10050 [Winogradskyella sp.]|uniref:hypothetical protein n=1 Tax=Winogradskyella sp. TaxID=1883156 RepID=UPI000F3F7F9D|nr:hypothetical protein [Winogradskyella sp.]RNC84916.1 MAG: hypothetical protein ED556_10050 [Winogradskyella sp.]
MKHCYYRFLLFNLFFIVTLGVATAQSELKIQLQDESNNDAISYATVLFQGTSRGLISNVDGIIRLPFNTQEDLPVLEISSLGYTTLIIDSKSLSVDKLNVLKLSPRLETLEEVVINTTKKGRNKSLRHAIDNAKKIPAHQIVSIAVNSVGKNMSNNPYSTIGYYRDYQIVKREYYNLNEGILEDFDAGISTDKLADSSNVSVLHSYQKNKRFKANSDYESAYSKGSKYIQNATILPYGGNEYSLLMVHDAVRNYNRLSYSFVYRLNTDFIKNHQFKKGKVSFYNDEPIIEISFEGIPKKIGYRHKPNGVIRISLIDFSIYYLEYTVTDGFKENPLFSIKNEYRKMDGKMYLNYITFNNRFVIAERDVFKESKIVYNKKDNSFLIDFNSNLDLKTIKKKHFKIKYNNKRVFVKSVETNGARQVVLKIPDFIDTLKNLDSETTRDLKVAIKDVYDINGRLIYEPNTIKGYQFREYFVQEVKSDNSFNGDFEKVNKNQRLKAPKIKDDSISQNYIINSPLIRY